MADWHGGILGNATISTYGISITYAVLVGGGGGSTTQISRTGVIFPSRSTAIAQPQATFIPYTYAGSGGPTFGGSGIFLSPGDMWAQGKNTGYAGLYFYDGASIIDITSQSAGTPPTASYAYTSSQAVSASYLNPQTQTMYIAAMHGWGYLHGNTSASFSTPSAHWEARPSTTGGTWYWFIPIALPNGTTITGVTCYYTNASGNTFSATLEAEDVNNSSYTGFGSKSGGSSPGSLTWGPSADSLPHTMTSTYKFYGVKCQMSPASSTTIGVSGIKVDYTTLA